jgi:hypothetical protein
MYGISRGFSPSLPIEMSTCSGVRYLIVFFGGLNLVLRSCAHASSMKLKARAYRRGSAETAHSML